uniref:EH domain-containing protein n=2 Tax=Caenorhabditis japonica TaxID=281687 RepID=A0A8R1I2T8_CAEJA
MTGKFDSQILEEVIRSGNIPCHGKTGMLCAGSGLLPPALLDESRVPKFYLDALFACGGTTSSALPNTGLVYNLMNTSGLPKDVLSHIWSAVNRAKPGQLTRPEFFSLLALIALTQKDESLAALCAMDSLPIPYLNPVQAFPTPANPAPVTNTSSSFVPFAKIKPSAFIPTSLLPRRSMRKKKEPDSKEASAHNSPAKGAVNDLAGLDFGGGGADSSDNKPEPKEETPNQMCWRETVHAIYIIVEEANQLFEDVRKDVLQEIADTEKGAAYFKSLAKAFETLERVRKSAGVLLSVQSTKEAEYCSNLKRKWEPYLEHEPELDLIDERTCAICCQPARNPIDYGGQCFDVTCANLWVNGVSSTLPSLHFK